MNENFTQPSDNTLEFAASFLRRSDQPVPTSNPAALSDHVESAPPREERFYEPERWDGLS
jgi:hypothetical protein